MRRKDKEIKDNIIIADFINSSKVCRLGLIDDGLAYIVPVHHIYHDNCLFFHSAKAGKKVDILSFTNQASFELDNLSNIEILVPACKSGSSYISIMGVGEVELVRDLHTKRDTLIKLMLKFSNNDYTFTDAEVDSVYIYKLTISSLSCKKSC